MTQEPWKDIERLYHAALEHDESERAAFLERACGGDESLRREVESLLVYQPKAGDFMEGVESGGERRPAWLASFVRPSPSASIPGRLVGRVFGDYHVQALIAAGGMGEVYRAIDTRLNRLVAIKVLPEHLSDHPERRERFKREARLVSSLSHPHVCALYHVGSQDDLDYLVMEHLDGETLEHRLKRGRLKWPEALEPLLQIAGALEAAHRQGIVHRDLKPANVMLTKSGAKVLDFGLAARRAPGHGSTVDPALDASKGLTVEGRIMGTVPYMSPEQLQGKPTDVRTDIFAFGALAYETVTGKRAFDAESQADLIGAILKDDPEPIATAAPDVPPLLARALARCLSKDPDERWQTTTDLLFQLRSIEESAASGVAASTQRRSSRRVATVLWLAAIGVSLFMALPMWMRSNRLTGGNVKATASAVRFSLPAPEGTTFPASFDVPFALSPDGRQIAYVAARPDGTRHLWVRALDSDEHRVLAGTDGATSPFWSPDSEWVGFFAGGSLKKVRVTSPIAQVVATPAATIGGAAWSRRDVIVFPGPGGLLRVAAGGGTVSRVGNDANYHLWPQFLDDGEHYLYASFTPRNLMLGSLANEPSRTLMTFPVNVSSLAYVPGFVLFVQDGVLFATSFDARRRELTGAPRRLVDGIPVTGPGRAPFSVSAAGLLAFSTDPVGTPAVLRWFTRHGRVSPAVDLPAKYFGFAVSPDQREVAFSRVGRHGGPDLWVRTLDRGTETQLTFDGSSYTPVWSPDGSRILFTGIAERPPPMLFVKDVRLAGAAIPLGAASGPVFASSWSGGVMLGVSVGLGGPNGNDLWMQRAGSSQRERLPIDTESNESEGRLSPDARWLAYTSDRTGRDEVWVASFPSGTPRRQVSDDGGMSPQWCEGQSRIVYLASDNHLVSVPLQPVAGRIELGVPQPLFRIDVTRFDRTLAPTANYYAATADCQRFLVASRPPVPQSPPISVVVNWQALLAR